MVSWLKLFLLSGVCLAWSEDRLANGMCRYGNRVACCWGWTQETWGRCRPMCELGCKHGKCVGPDQCHCHAGYTGKTCNQGGCVRSWRDVVTFALTYIPDMLDITILPHNSSPFLCPVDLNECGLKPRPCLDRCMNTLGSYKCYCLHGYMTMRDGTCRNARTCAMTNCQYGCAVMKGEVVCQCPSPGLRLAPDRRTCVDIDECVTGDARCPRFRKCVNTFGSYICRCHRGFELHYVNGKYQCTDKNDFSICRDKPGSKNCKCKTATYGKGYDCKHKNDFSICRDKPGSKNCKCKTATYGKGYDCKPSQTSNNIKTYNQNHHCNNHQDFHSSNHNCLSQETCHDHNIHNDNHSNNHFTNNHGHFNKSSINNPNYCSSNNTNYCRSNNPKYCRSNKPNYCSSNNPNYCSSNNHSYCRSNNPNYCSSSNPNYCRSNNPNYCSSSNPNYCRSNNPNYWSSNNPNYCRSNNPNYCSSNNPKYWSYNIHIHCNYNNPNYCSYKTSNLCGYNTSYHSTLATTAAPPSSSAPSIDPLITSTLDNRIQDITHRPRGDVHIPRNTGENSLFDLDFDIELGNTEGYARDDPGAGSLSCSFDHGVCSWMTDGEGDLHWEAVDDPAGGRYLIVPEATTGPSVKGARLTIPLAPPLIRIWQGGDLCLSFRHLLSGHHTGSLQVFVRKGRSHSPAIWTRTGGQGWRNTQITAWGRGLESVVLKGERRKGGKIAVDDFRLQRGACRDSGRE
ncbi:hypothetical protein P4O66_020746 [Electrophorus voltai]|uniref:Nephronectin n=1 Tax=Electrophorus voltai TaxID=2609070 RepID=A0AAD8ZQQ4_9TELE|nr:hypothetical protein P4O66_020746 [Electrophorus voltai]